jgi:2-polyprenyl-6-methoxyphenol hydroxylase-like FAD-dependent oxidoreductase
LKNSKILISGAGIAGPTLAYWLGRYGFEPTFIERAPALREGRYIIDFWRLGFDVAEKMGLLAAMKNDGYDIDEVRIADERGERIGGFNVCAIQSTVGRYLSILRSDLAKLIYESLGGKVRTIFDGTIKRIEQDNDSVHATFEHAAPESFDLVIGAGGLHSPVRSLVFGSQSRYEKYLGYYTASFSLDGYPHRDVRPYVSYAMPGRQASRYALRGGRTIFFFVFSRNTKSLASQHDLVAQEEILRDAFGKDGSECPAILKAMETCSDLYFDSVSQIRMDTCSQGRVALIGDACFCPSLLAGEGSALAMAGAYVLARELNRVAFRRYEELFHPFVLNKQRAAERFSGSFAPKTKFGIFVRNQVARLMSLPFVADLTMGRLLSDALTLPARCGADRTTDSAIAGVRSKSHQPSQRTVG